MQDLIAVLLAIIAVELWSILRELYTVEIVERVGGEWRTLKWIRQSDRKQIARALATAGLGIRRNGRIEEGNQDE